MHKMVDYCTEGHCLATESCPLESVEQRAYLDFVREDYGPNIKADDDAYLISSLEKLTEPSETNPIGGCPAHNGLPPVNPEDPLSPGTGPNGGETTFPGTQDPYVPGPGESHEGYGGSGNQGGTTTQPPSTVNPEPNPPAATPDEPEEPITPDPNPGGGLFDDLWGIAM